MYLGGGGVPAPECPSKPKCSSEEFKQQIFFPGYLLVLNWFENCFHVELE